ncbi:four helix bundle protein [Aquisalinus flavus]|nr:four helix bundle protein [Aquisalinus flavus]UNE49262.1 four helix bundle protein [Aquisalinus flavus]
MDLSVEIYRITSAYPREEQFGLVSQMRRSSVSIPSNIAEGFGRETTQAFIQFLRISQGSLKELETQILLSRRLEFIKEQEAGHLLGQSTRIGKMLNGLIRKLIGRKDR